MLKQTLFSLFTILLLFSCSKKDDFPVTKNTTKGEKWSLKIGSSPEEVYEQLQLLGEEKGFSGIGIAYRKPYTSPEEIKDIFKYYDALTIQNKSGVINRVILQIGVETITGIEAGGALPDPVASWPADVPAGQAVMVGDLLDDAYTKMVDLYENVDYSNWGITLSDKPLNKDYDFDLEHYPEWAFDFFEDINNGMEGRHQVRLYFKNQKLVRIQDTYDQHQTYN